MTARVTGGLRGDFDQQAFFRFLTGFHFRSCRRKYDDELFRHRTKNPGYNEWLARVAQTSKAHRNNLGDEKESATRHKGREAYNLRSSAATAATLTTRRPVEPKPLWNGPSSIIVSPKSGDSAQWKKSAEADPLPKQRSLQPDNANVAQALCNAVKTSLEDNSFVPNTSGQNRVSCNCGSNFAIDGSNLFCNDACQYCNADQSVCGFESYGVTYNSVGSIVATAQTFSYLQGRTELIFMERNGCVSGSEGANGEVTNEPLPFQNDDLICSGCNVYVDGQKCSTCSLTTCLDGTQQPDFNCDNIDTNNAMMSYNLRPESIGSIPGNHVFEFLQRMVDTNPSMAASASNANADFGTCYLGGRPHNGNSNPGSPSSSPPGMTASPPPTSINATSCPLSIRTNQCGSLIEQQMTTPIENCDCYNYCGGSYVSCCSMTEGCSVQCNSAIDGTGGPIVAGCRLDVDYSSVNNGNADNGGCQATDPITGIDYTFDEGESFQELVHVSQCVGSGNTWEDFQCYCDTITENDSIRCPYCLFDTIEADVMACAGDGESVSFTDPQGVEQTCTCHYIVNGMAQTVCEMTTGPGMSTPMTETGCLLENHQERCPSALSKLFSTSDPDNSMNLPDMTESPCDCYNFCGETFYGCCEFGQACAMDCQFDSAGEGSSIVAGCSTLAPKVAISAASSKLSSGNG